MLRHLRRSVFLWALFVAVTPTLVAQCPDPPLPPGGFGFQEILDQSVVYADGAKTRIDVRFPTERPGKCGWPVVLVMHDGGSSKAQVAGCAQFFALRGYLTAAYDIRGRGSAYANPAALGHKFLGEPERLDVVEIVNYLAATYPEKADVSRLAMTGQSHGGQQSWMAAAMSGKTLPPNSRGLTVFPTFKAVYPIIFAPLDERTTVPQGVSFRTGIARKHVSTTKKMEPVFKQNLTNRLTAEDYAGVAAIWSQDPWRQDRQKLATSNTAVMVSVQWNDIFMPVDRSIEALDAMPSTTPTRAFLSAFGAHGDVRNNRARSQTTLFSWRWFDRFLKGIPNQVDVEPRFVSAVVPDSLEKYQAPSTLLWNRYSDTWPPASAQTVTYYLRQGGALATSPPTSVEPNETIRHRVSSKASMQALMQTVSTFPLIRSWFPVDSKTFDGPILTADTEIAGSPRVVLEVDPSGPNYQVHVALYQVTAAGFERYLQSGVGLVRGDPSPRQLDIDVHDIHALLGAGERLRLRIENITLRFPPGSAPGARDYYIVPYFDDVDIDLVHTAARPSWLELPVMPHVDPALSCADLMMHTAGIRDLTLALESRPSLAGSPYFTLLGLSGITPGVTLPGGALARLNVDALTGAVIPLLNGAFLPNGLGTLDAMGNASPAPRIMLRQIPSSVELAGLRGIVLGVVQTPGGWRATNPLEWVVY